MRAVLLVSLLCAAAVAQDAPRPNVLLILCDDMGFSDLGCFGGEVETPTLDRLAAEGARFTQFYTCAKCTTTRAALVTGRYPRPGDLPRGVPTIGEQMQAAGYRTALIGKWHLGRGEHRHPAKRGFERVYGLLDGCCNFFDPAQRDPDFKGGRVRWFTDQEERITEFPDGYYTTDAFAAEAARWIDEVGPGEEPWFLHLCFTAPHYPLHARPDDIAKYRGRYAELGGWFAMREQRFARQQAMGLATDAWRLSGRDLRAYDWEGADQDWEDLRMATYAGMIDAMDRAIAGVLQAVDRVGDGQDTLVVFLSDNGGCAEEPGGRDPSRVPGPKEDYTAVGPSWGWAQNAPFARHKSWVHEGGITTPMIAWWPGRIDAGRIERQPGHVMDFVPTLLELAGAEPLAAFESGAAPALEGRSYAAVLLGDQREPHPELCWLWAGNRAIRRGDWKLVWDSRTRVWELYDIAGDRCETRDLAAEHPARVAELAAAWETWGRRTGVWRPR